MTDNLMTLEQAAERLQVSQRSIWRAVQTRELAVVRIGRLLRFAPRDLDAYVSSRRAAAEDERSEYGA